MYRLTVGSVLCVLILQLPGCQKVDEDTVATVGSKVYSFEDLRLFTSMLRFFPMKNPGVFPKHRKAYTTMIESSLLYDKAPGSLKGSAIRESLEWQWRNRYYEGQIYLTNVVMRDLGFSEEEITQYYDAHRESFKSIIKVPVGQSADSSASDSGAAKPAETRDSTTYRPLKEVRGEIVKELFVNTYPPESTFVKRTFGNDTTVGDTQKKEQWFHYMSRALRTERQDFFLEKFYKEYYGHAMSDSVEAWFGEGKLITEEDVAVFRNWMPERDRAHFSTPRGSQALARWALRYRIYARKAQETGYAETAEIKGTLEWAWKFHVVDLYVHETLIPSLSETVSLDSTLATFSYWDIIDKVQIPPKPEDVKKTFTDQFNRQVSVKLDSVIHALRKAKGVEFYKEDYRDAKSQSPEVLLHQADSLRDSGKTAEAEKAYRALSNEFAFTPQGAQGYAELAKILTEKQRYRDAIRSYRLHLSFTDDKASMCNTYFMIGFIYDEYQNKPELAEANYKWVLKNAPDCELADDAEFMMLHLDEPMIRIEDLRAEALRQGREVDYDEQEGEAESVAESE